MTFFDQPIEWGRAMLLSLMYLVIRMQLRLVVPSSQGEAAKKLGIVLLRHETECPSATEQAATFSTFWPGISRGRGPTTATDSQGRFRRDPKDAAALASGAGPLEAGSIQQTSQGRPPLPAEGG